MASVSPPLPSPTTQAPKCSNPKTPKVSQSVFYSPFFHFDTQHPKPIPTSRDESSLHQFRSHAKALALVRRSGFMRRNALLGMLLSASSFSFLALGSFAETDLFGSFRAYEDETNKFRIFVPEGWSVGTGETSSIKSVTAFYPEETSDSNGKRLGQKLAEAPRHCSEAHQCYRCKCCSPFCVGLYYIEYTLQKPGDRCRHIFSAVGIASNGWYNRLYTVTGQFMDDEEEKYKSLIEKSVLSFRLIQS